MVAAEGLLLALVLVLTVLVVLVLGLVLVLVELVLVAGWCGRERGSGEGVELGRVDGLGVLRSGRMAASASDRRLAVSVDDEVLA